MWNWVADAQSVGAFNQEKALVGAFSVIVKTNCETDESFYSTDVYSTQYHCGTITSSAEYPPIAITWLWCQYPD